LVFAQPGTYLLGLLSFDDEFGPGFAWKGVGEEKAIFTLRAERHGDGFDVEYFTRKYTELFREKNCCVATLSRHARGACFQ
jgi:hypothetical protein